MAENFRGFILVDVETTGLMSPKDGHVLELGMAHFDQDLNMLDMFQSLVLTRISLKYIEDGWDRNDFAYKMHDNSGLLADLDALGNPGPEVDPVEVSRRAVQWLQTRGVTKGMKVPMTGSSVHFDKEWLTFHMPQLTEMFGYRTIDASGMREYTRVVAPDLASKIDADTKSANQEHRVMPDILDTVQLLAAMRKHGAIIS